MKARFELHHHESEVVLVVQPDDEREAMLMEVFLNHEVTFRALVERAANGRVREVILRGEGK